MQAENKEALLVEDGPCLLHQHTDFAVHGKKSPIAFPGHAMPCSWRDVRASCCVRTGEDQALSAASSAAGPHKQAADRTWLTGLDSQLG